MTSKVQLFLISALLVPCWVIAAQYEIDFVNLYRVCEFARNDLSTVYGYNGSLGRFFYGPISLVLLWPLSLTSFVVAKWIWIVLQTVSYVLFWYYFYKLYPVLKEQRAFWGWVVVFILAINPIHNNYQSNNIQLMIMAAFVMAEYWAREKSQKLQICSGVLVALMAAIKVFPLFLVVYYVLTRSRSVRLGLWLGLFLSLAVPTLFFGLEESALLHRDFLRGLTTYEADNPLTRSPDILCLPSLVARLVPAPWVSLVTKFLVGVLSSAFLAWAYWTEKVRKTPSVQIHFWAIALAMMAFLNPSTRPHYFIFYLPAAVSVLEFVLEKKRRSLALGVLLLSTVLIAFTQEGVVGKDLNNRLEAWSLPTYGFLLLTSLLVFQLWGRLRNLSAVALSPTPA